MAIIKRLLCLQGRTINALLGSNVKDRQTCDESQSQPKKLAHLFSNKSYFMDQSREYLTATAHLFTCQLILQGVCDELAKSRHYKFLGKKYVNELQRIVSPDVLNHYQKLDAESELGLYEVQRSYENLSQLILKLKLKDFQRINFLVPYLLDIPDSDFSKCVSLLESYRAGEVFEANTPQLLDNFIKQGRIKPVTSSNCV